MTAILDTAEEAWACSRRDGRIPVSVPAELELARGSTDCSIEDISMGGARIRLHIPPKQGTLAILRFGGYQVFGAIAWAKGHCCGMKFDNRIPKEVVFLLRDFGKGRFV
jgi:hypothetical protein